MYLSSLDSESYLRKIFWKSEKVFIKIDFRNISPSLSPMFRISECFYHPLLELLKRREGRERVRSSDERIFQTKTKTNKILIFKLISIETKKNKKLLATWLWQNFFFQLNLNDLKFWCTKKTDNNNNRWW